MQFSELWEELKKFADGNSSLDVVKGCFNLFWNRTHMSQDVNKETIAKAESLHIAMDLLEVGYFSRKNFLELIHSYASA